MTDYKDFIEHKAVSALHTDSIQVDADDLNPMLYSFQYVPTTLFVDSEGKVIADMVIGADLEKYVSTLESLLEGWTYEG